jgi:hypothetical protein
MIGALAGMTEVTIMQPTVAIKNALQEGRPLPRTPVAYYRGLAVSNIMFATYSSKYLSNCGKSCYFFEDHQSLSPHIHRPKLVFADQCWDYASHYCRTIWHE